MSKANSSTLIYRIPYQNLNSKDELFSIDNPFIVYILFGKNESGKDVIYVGKSKNGLKNRPTSHEDKYDKWTYCFVLTQFKERTFRDDEAIEEETDIDTDEKTDVVPDGTYYLKRKIKRANITIKATMQATGGKYIVLKGSMVCENEGPGLSDNIIEARKAATIVNGKLYNDVTFSSPSAASQFVIGAASNGWTNWKCDDGSAIDKFRN